jgi:asparagine synthase (glutamine-hydrolysing)
VPESILSRTKQPYRAPDALAFIGPARPDWVDAVLSPEAVSEAGVFDPAAVGLLWQKCRNADATARFSNADNMALVGVLSTQLLHEALVKRAPAVDAPARIDTLVDRMRERT